MKATFRKLIAFVALLAMASPASASHFGWGAEKWDAVCNVGWNLMDFEACSSECESCEFYPAYDDPAWPRMYFGDLIENRCRKHAFTGAPPAGPHPSAACRSCAGYTFSGEGGIVYMTRSSATSQVLLRDGVGGTLFDTDDLGFDYEFGPSLRLTGKYSGNPWEFEFVYYGIHDFLATGSVVGNNTQLLIDSNPTIALVNDPTFRYDSQIDNLEFNMYLAAGCCLPRSRWMIGARWIELDDNYSVAGTEFLTNQPLQHGIRAYNHMYGFQLGLETNWVNYQCGRTTLNSTIKAGVFGNTADQSTTFDDQATNVTVTSSDDSSSFTGEVGITGKYQVNDWCSLRANYTALWIEGVALAPDQIQRTSLVDPPGIGSTLDMSGGTLYHGAFFGVEFRR
ncbi:MAG: hypothetical protein ACI9G1_000741 [Pirellulaceae bacterium]|jgi:hypothetical protein